MNPKIFFLSFWAFFYSSGMEQLKRNNVDGSTQVCESGGIPTTNFIYHSPWGKTDWNLAGKLQGHECLYSTQCPSNFEQAKKVAQFLQKETSFFYSALISDICSERIKRRKKFRNYLY